MNPPRNGNGELKFGTFGGVFTPCTLTILGVIMFLRFGQVVGQAGIVKTFVIVLLAKSITLLTAFSLSAIATNTQVKGGGAYFLISRSLGVEFGGAIGIVFFLAQAISVAMYVMGFGEAFLNAFPLTGLSLPVLSSLVNLAVFLCVMIGAGWAIKIQYVILAILALSIVSFFGGAWPDWQLGIFQENLSSSYTDGENFFSMFALFFPAVTGIMAGANMSGDLREPGRSIPRGTLTAIFVTGGIYLCIALMLAGARPADQLIANNLIMKELGWSPALMTAGVFVATLSSALGSMMGAPRILQAFSRDEIFPAMRFFSVGSGPANEPRRATLLTFAISQACILLADLNAIAPIITMAFMITYGTLNLATFYESITRNPSYRPQFRFSHWSTALLGALGCLAVMFLMEPVWAAVSVMAMAVLHRQIARREIQSRWGDVRSGVVFERTRRNLLKLEEEQYHPKNWRPTILALSGSAWNRQHLAVYGHWLTAGHGILTLAHVIPGEVEDLYERRKNQEALLRKFIRQSQLKAFPVVVAAPYLTDGIEWLVQCHGLGGLRPNTVLLGWPKDPQRGETFGCALRTVAGLQRSVVCIRCLEDAELADPWQAELGTIDVWWRGRKNGGLMLLLAHLLTRNPDWRNREIRLLRVVSEPAAAEEVSRYLDELSERARIPVTTSVVVSSTPEAAIRETSRDAAVVFLGFEIPEEGQESGWFERMDMFAGELDTVIFVNSAGGMELES